jgi:hypothetical protein
LIDRQQLILATVVFLERIDGFSRVAGSCETGTGTSSPAAVNNDEMFQYFFRRTNRNIRRLSLWNPGKKKNYSLKLNVVAKCSHARHDQGHAS